MTKDVYDRINEYCTSKYNGVLVQAERDYVLRMVLENYCAAIDEQTKSNNQPLTQEQEETILNSLLTEKIMNDNIVLAKKYYSELKENLYVEFEKKQNKPTFFKDVGVNILSNFVYSVILILIFFVAKDQLSSWLAQLIS